MKTKETITNAVAYAVDYAIKAVGLAGLKLTSMFPKSSDPPRPSDPLTGGRYRFLRPRK